MIDILGNAAAQSRLKDLFLKSENSSYGSAFLLEGPRHIGKMLAASSYALEGLKKTSDASIALWEMHPDLHIYKPGGKLALHTIESMKQLVQEVTLPPTLAKFKVFIIQDAERLTDASGNFLLKTLEEPPADTCILLTTSKPEALLRTIYSRLEVIKFSALESEEIASWLISAHSVDPKDATSLSALSKGAPGLAHRYAGERFDEFLLFLSSSLNRLYKGDLSSIERSDLSDHLAGFIDRECSHLEKELTSRQKERDEALTPFVKEQLKKQAEAEVALLRQELNDELFELIYLFYRDRLIGVESAPRLFPGKGANAALAIDTSKLVQVENLLIEAKKALRYSIKLKTALYTLFLNLSEL